MLEHCGALIVAHGATGRLVHWNQKIRKLIIFFFLHLSGRLAPALWYTHPGNIQYNCHNVPITDHLVDGVTDGLVRPGAVLLGDWAALLAVDGGAHLRT